MTTITTRPKVGLSPRYVDSLKSFGLDPEKFRPSCESARQIQDRFELHKIRSRLSKEIQRLAERVEVDEKFGRSIANFRAGLNLSDARHEWNPSRCAELLHRAVEALGDESLRTQRLPERGSQKSSNAESGLVPWRPLENWEQRSKLFSTCLHEAGHVAILIVEDPNALDFAAVARDLSGICSQRRHSSRETEIRCLVAGYAISTQFGVPGTGCHGIAASDASQLQKLGVRVFRPDIDSSLLRELQPHHESNQFRALKESIRDELRPHLKRIERIAELLWLNVGSRVPADAILKCWNSL